MARTPESCLLELSQLFAADLVCECRIEDGRFTIVRCVPTELRDELVETPVADSPRHTEKTRESNSSIGGWHRYEVFGGSGIWPAAASHTLFRCESIRGHTRFVALCWRQAAEVGRMSLADDASAIDILNAGDLLFEERHEQERGTRLFEAIEVLDPHRVDESIARVLALVHREIGASMVSLWSSDDMDNALVLRAHFPRRVRDEEVNYASFDRRVLPLRASLSYRTVQSGRPETFNNICTDPIFANPKLAALLHVNSMISFPVAPNGEGVRGVVNAYFPNETAIVLDPVVSRLTSLLLSQLAVCMELALVLRKKRVSEVLQSACQSLSSDGDRKAAWDQIALRTAEQLGCEACSVFLADERGGIRLRGTTGLVGDPPYGTVRYERGVGLTGHVFASNVPLIYYRELATSLPVSHRSLFREKLRSGGKSASIALVPIQGIDGQAIGVIRCNNKDERPSQSSGRFTRDDVSLLQSIGDVAFNTYLRNAKLLERERAFTNYANRLQHEILHPLDGIMSHIEWLAHVHQTRSLSDPATTSLIKRRSKDVLESVRLAENIVRSIGHAHATAPASLELLSLRDIVLTSRAWLTSEARQRGITVYIAEVQPTRLRGDRHLLLRLVYNLLVNSIKYSDRTETARFVRLRTATSAGLILLDVEDNGIGIEPGTEEVIFREGFRGENACRVFPQGTGLGLSFCRQIVESHGGEIQVAHAAKPTRFRVTIPKHEERV